MKGLAGRLIPFIMAGHKKAVKVLLWFLSVFLRILFLRSSLYFLGTALAEMRIR